MVAFYIVFFLLVIGSIVFLLVARNKKWNLEKAMKITLIVVMSLALLNMFLPDSFAFMTADPTAEEYIFDSARYNPFYAVTRLLDAMTLIVLPVALFYKKSTFKKIVVYLVIPTIILNVVMYYQTIEYYCGDYTKNFLEIGHNLWHVCPNIVIRTLIFGVIMLGKFVVSSYIHLDDPEACKFHNKKEVLYFAIITLACLYVNMPLYFPQNIIGGFSDIKVKLGHPIHIVWLVLLPCEIIALTFIFKNKCYEDKYILILVMALSAGYQYSTFYTSQCDMDLSKLPLHLCNLGCLFVLLTALTRKERLFHFVLVSNVLGGLIAAVMCDTYSTGFFNVMNMHYFICHRNIIIVPILMGILGIFKPLKIKDLKHVLIGFSIYWAITLIVGTCINASFSAAGDTFRVNYFFMFRKDRASKLIGSWVKPFFDAKLTLGNAELYLAQLIILIVYSGLSAGVFFIMYNCFKKKKPDQVEQA